MVRLSQPDDESPWVVSQGSLDFVCQFAILPVTLRAGEEEKLEL
jgi:hypothetical protein